MDSIYWRPEYTARFPVVRTHARTHARTYRYTMVHQHRYAHAHHFRYAHADESRESGPGGLTREVERPLPLNQPPMRPGESTPLAPR